MVQTSPGRPFRILFDAHTFDTGWQGTTTYLTGLLNALPEAVSRALPGTDLQITCAAASEAAIRDTVSVPFDFVPIRSSFAVRNAVDLPRAAQVIGVDLVVSQYVRPFRVPCATLSVIHDVLFLDYPESFSWKYRTLRRTLFGWSARNSTYVAAVSAYSADRIAAHFGTDAADILLTPNAVDPVFLAEPAPAKAPGAPLSLLSVSRLEQRKRHEWGIHALDRLAEAGIAARYAVIGGGGGDYAHRLRADIDAARARGLDVELRSGVPFPDLVAAYAAADIFLCPSEAEGFGIPVIEAAAAGAPCVVSDGGALAEFDGHYVGREFPADSLEAFLQATTEVAQDIDTLRAAARANRDAVDHRYRWSKVADTYADVIRDILETRA